MLTSNLNFAFFGTKNGGGKNDDDPVIITRESASGNPQTWFFCLKGVNQKDPL